jgi:DNA-binding transcriptional regulator YiaG
MCNCQCSKGPSQAERQEWRQLKELREEEERPYREEMGSEVNRRRVNMNVSRNRLAKASGIAWGTLKKFESGEVVQRRRLVEKSVTNALDGIQMDHFLKGIGVVIPVPQLPVIEI